MLRSFLRPLAMLIAIPLLIGALGACGTTTVDPKSGETLIRSYVTRSSGLTLQSVRCPSGVKPKDGTSFDCKVALRDNTNATKHSGTITVHITGGGKKVEILGGQDVHVR